MQPIPSLVRRLRSSVCWPIRGLRLRLGKGSGVGKLNGWKGACALILLCTATTIILAAPSFTTLVKFDLPDGSQPRHVVLVQGIDGDLYGATYYGGASTACGQVRCGTVFKITPAGTLTTLYSFDFTHGANPDAGLVQATDGNFYGTTTYGGASGACSGGCGTVFKITPTGTLTTLHSFDNTDGANPVAGLVQATDGNFYGTTQVGGASTACTSGCGTVFKITSVGGLTTLHSFDESDGYGPEGGLAQATDGNFYGTTLGGGANESGTVFKITPAGSLTTLHSFCSEADCYDGLTPYGGVVQATDGNFWGTTYSGDCNGSVFKMTPAGTLTTLYCFGYTDGANPSAGLVQATDGNFYGTTQFGGTSSACEFGCGTVFELTPMGVLTTLHSFSGSDGEAPEGGLVQGTSGTLYGTTSFDTTYGDGTVFSLTVGLGPFVKTLPTFGRAGAPVNILGTNLTHAISISFNGTAAAFEVVSSSEITATVPPCATTGTVTVVIAGLRARNSVLSSNVPFRVLPRAMLGPPPCRGRVTR